jgi:hypothetical protein
MTEHELDLRLRSIARALDSDAPTFDAARLQSVRGHRARRRALALAVVAAAAGIVAAPSAVSAIGDLFRVDEVPVIGALEPGVTGPYGGRSLPFDAARLETPFRLRTIGSLGAPHDTRVRDDVVGGIVTLVYHRDTWILLTQWRTADVSARVAVVPTDGVAEQVTVGGVPALWIQGAARGTFTLVGADGTVHRESFEVGSGALLWKRDGMTFLLQGRPSKDDAIRLAADVDR